MTPDEKAKYLYDSDEFEKIHAECSLEGSSEVIEDVEVHFMAFVEIDGLVYELDVRQGKPGCLGELQGDNLGVKVSPYIKKYIELDPEEKKYSMLALAGIP